MLIDSKNISENKLVKSYLKKLNGEKTVPNKNINANTSTGRGKCHGENYQNYKRKVRLNFSKEISNMYIDDMILYKSVLKSKRSID